MERAGKERAPKRLGGGLKDRPQCERCGRLVKVDQDSLSQEEILCPYCASDARVSDDEDYESGAGWM